MPSTHTHEIWASRSPGLDYDQSHPKMSGGQPTRRMVLNRLGSNLNGQVYKVSDENHCKPHAIVKVINIAADQKPTQNANIKAIRQEITKLQFSNASLAKSVNLIVGTVTLGSAMCLISPYCPGGSLKSYLDSNMPLSQHQTSVVLYEVASALWRVHHQGFTHGNIKSSNVLFSETGSIQLSDFSFVNLSIAGLTHAQRIASASPHWAAPELLDPKSNYTITDNSMDIWSFGILAYELSTGTAPYADCQDASSLHAAIARCGPPRLSPAHPQSLQDLIAICLHLDPSQRPKSAHVLAHQYFQGMSGEASRKVLRNLAEEYQERDTLRLIARSPVHPTSSSLSPELDLLLANDIPSTAEMKAIQEQFYVSDRRCSSPFDLDSLLSPPQGFSAHDDAPFDTSFVNTPIQRFLEEDPACYEDLILDISCPPSPPPLLSGSGSWTDLPGTFSPGSDTDEASVYSNTHDSAEPFPPTPGDSFEATVPIALRRGDSFTISARASISTRSSGCLSSDDRKPRRDAPDFLSSVVTAFKKLQESASTTNLNLAFQSSITSGAKATSSTTKPSTSSPLWSPFRPSSSNLSGRFPPISAPILSSNSTPIFMPPSTPPPTPATPAQHPSATVTNNDITPLTTIIHDTPMPLTTSENEKALPPLPQLPTPRMVPRSAGQGQLYPRRKSHPRRKSSLSIWPQQKPLSVFHRPNASISNMVSTLQHQQFVAERGLSYTALEVCGPVQRSYFEMDDDVEKDGKVKQEFKRIVSNLSDHLAGSGSWLRRTRGATR